jgi:hypothetical protein
VVTSAVIVVVTLWVKGRVKVVWLPLVTFLVKVTGRHLGLLFPQDLIVATLVTVGRRLM